ncbi:AAA family ATPase [Janthinobacterium violaceinigrum]|uniref:AAA family ATPase n=1 Tax=Janthinobacterium violaceinigrum TaxID=2654252 RepID=A0A6I1I203_9BURK|nr:ATP-binding protein [Janthinobacterium violaceinigrum]KAB8061807.1 AAA family ATPase [Janthinobacterium violaceinigrum]
MAPLVRVAILGAESSGKSTLAAALAERHGTVWVPEYLREFVETQGRVPVAADQFGIARMQVEREAAAAALARHFLFCDTTPLMTVVYSRHYFNGADAPLAALADAHQYDVTIVTAPDSPWIPDGLQRESESVRQLIHCRLLEELAVRRIAYLLVSGPLAQRLQQVDDWMSGRAAVLPR